MQIHGAKESEPTFTFIAKLAKSSVCERLVIMSVSPDQRLVIETYTHPTKASESPL